MTSSASDRAQGRREDALSLAAAPARLTLMLRLLIAFVVVLPSNERLADPAEAQNETLASAFAAVAVLVVVVVRVIVLAAVSE